MRAVKSLKILHFDQILLSKAYKDLGEKVQKSYVLWRWRVMQGLKKNWLLVLNFNAILMNFNENFNEDLPFNVLLLSIAYKVSAKKVRKNYLSWHWKKIQILKKS